MQQTSRVKKLVLGLIGVVVLPYWGCYTGGEAEYANQWELSGGIVIRF